MQLIDDAVAMGLIIALVEVAKVLGLPTRFAPVLSLALGIGAAFIWVLTGWQDALVTGLLWGLTASGLYSGTRATVSK